MDPIWPDSKIEDALHSVAEPQRVKVEDARSLLVQERDAYEAVLAQNVAEMTSLLGQIRDLQSEVSSRDSRITELEAELPQVSVTIGPEILKSRFEIAVTHADNKSLFYAPDSVKQAGLSALKNLLHWQQKSMMSWGAMDPWDWDGTGTRPPAPTNWGNLDAWVAMMKQADKPIALNTDLFSWHLRGTWNQDGTTRKHTVADRWSSTGTLLTDEVQNYRLLIRTLALRYLKDVRIWCTGTEYHGLFLGRDAQNKPTFKHYRFDNYAGTPGSADMGAAYRHNITVEEILNAAATLKIDPTSLTIINNYPPLVVYGKATSDCVPVGHPLRDRPWGSLDARSLEVIDLMIPLLKRCDLVGFDLGTHTKDGVYPAKDDIENLGRYDDILRYFSFRWPDKQFICMETYDKPRLTQNPTEQYRCMIRADAFRRMLIKGLRSAVIWGTAGEAMGDAGLIPEAALLSTSTGLPTKMFETVRMFHDYFGPGTPIFDTTVTGGPVSALASDAWVMLINQSNVFYRVGIGLDSFALDPYEVRVVPSR